MSDHQTFTLVTVLIGATCFLLLLILMGLWRSWLNLNREIGELKSQASIDQDKLMQLNEQLSKFDEIATQKQELEKQLVERDVTLSKEREAFEEKLKVFEKAEEQLKDTFQSLSTQALKTNNTMFLELANSTFEKLREGAKSDLKLKEEAIGGLVKPINEGLKKFDERIHEMEKSRVAQISSVNDLIKDLTKANQETRMETQNLVSALRAPTSRGQWGELQLKRTIELAGMLNYCDFVEQKGIGGEGVNLRPDVIVRLPNNREVVIDAKAPLNAYLESTETQDATVKAQKLDQHARHIRDHLKKLGQKSYHEHLEQTPEFVVLFLPGEVFYSVALEQDPELIEYGVNQKVLIATPTTLIALLKAIAYGWRNQEIAEKAGEISKLGRDLFDSVVIMLEHMSSVRKSLNQTVDHFNKTIRSTNSRLIPRIRKFKETGAGGDKAIPHSDVIESSAQLIDIPNLLEEDK